jgi:hypothetical protein
MSHFSKFLPVVALAAVLATPFAASARSDHGPQAPAQQQLLLGQFGTAQSHGRAAEANAPGGQLVVVSAPQYAALTGVAGPEVN